jgi:hypothetical protein
VPSHSYGNALGEKIKKNTIKGFMKERSRRKMITYISTLNDIGLWVNSKNNENLDSSAEWKELLFLLCKRLETGRHTWSL